MRLFNPSRAPRSFSADGQVLFPLPTADGRSSGFAEKNVRTALADMVVRAARFQVTLAPLIPRVRARRSACGGKMGQINPFKSIPPPPMPLTCAGNGKVGDCRLDHHNRTPYSHRSGVIRFICTPRSPGRQSHRKLSSMARGLPCGRKRWVGWWMVNGLQMALNGCSKMAQSIRLPPRL